MADRQPQAEFNSKEGWLAKTGSNNRGWRDRYFVLSNGKVSYFKSEKDDTPLGHVDLKEVHEISISPGKRDKGFGFDLTVSSGRIYNFSAKSNLEQAEWVSALQASLEVTRRLHGPPAAILASSGSISSIKKPSGSISGGGILGRRRVATRKGSDSSLDDEMLRSTSPPANPQAMNRKSDVVVNSLLEAEVDALRRKISQLEEDLESAVTQRKVMQLKLEEAKEASEESIQQYNDEMIILKNKIHSLEESKSKLEEVNDSLAAQVQYKDDLISTLQQSIDELKDLEEEAKNWQEEAAAAKEGIEEIEEEQKELRDSLTKERQLRKEIEEKLNELMPKFEATEKERDRLKAAVSLQSHKTERSPINESELKEEKLQLQLEIENLKLSKSKEIADLEESFAQQNQSLISQLEHNQKQQKQLTSEFDALGKQYEDAQSKINELKESVRVTEERCKQLQIEKEKVVSDLITMRKSMKERCERESERPVVTTFRLSIDEEPPAKVKQDSPTLVAKLAEAEGRAEMATRLLQEIQTERDSLKVQLSGRRSVSPQPLARNEVDSSNHSLAPPPFLLKSQPSLAISRPDLPPPKPKRPPKELLQQLKL